MTKQKDNLGATHQELNSLPNSYLEDITQKLKINGHDMSYEDAKQVAQSADSANAKALYEQLKSDTLRQRMESTTKK